MRWWMKMLLSVFVVGLAGCGMTAAKEAPLLPSATPASSSSPALVETSAAAPVAITPVQAGETVQEVTAMPRATPVPSGTPAREMPAPGALPKAQCTPLPFPQPNDAQMSTASAYLTSFAVEAVAGGKLNLALQGNLPTPRHQLRVAVERGEGVLKVKVYSVVDAQQECVQVLQPFSVEVKAGPFPDGDYQVFVNDQAAGMVTIKH